MKKITKLMMVSLMMTVGAVSMHATFECTLDSDGKTTNCHDVNNTNDKPLKKNKPKKGSSSPMAGTSSATYAPLSFTPSEDFADENQTEGNYFPSSKTATINNLVFTDVEESTEQQVDGKVQIGSYFPTASGYSDASVKQYLYISQPAE